MCSEGADIDLGTVCVPITTGTAATAINNANEAQPVSSYGTSNTGTASDCGDLDASVLAGTSFVAELPFYDTTIGDVITSLRFGCE